MTKLIGFDDFSVACQGGQSHHPGEILLQGSLRPPTLSIPVLLQATLSEVLRLQGTDS